MKHLLALEKLPREDMERILADSVRFKQERGRHPSLPLGGQTWALIFSKSSTRTRVSFEVGIRELGGQVMFLDVNDIQLGRGEPIKDTARVLGRMAHGAVIRTFAQKDVEEFAQFSDIPTINALTDDEHPCQILTDIFSFQEKRGPIQRKVVTYVGDAACNVPLSWVFAAAKLGFELRLAAPKAYQPPLSVFHRAGVASVRGSQESDRPPLIPTTAEYPATGGKVILMEDLRQAAAGADLLYTDVWVSMGKEGESAERLRLLKGYQINDELVQLAKPGALVMHCLPAYRDKEIAGTTFERHAQTIFDEAENRLHVQKAILNWLVNE